MSIENKQVFYKGGSMPEDSNLLHYSLCFYLTFFGLFLFLNFLLQQLWKHPRDSVLKRDWLVYVSVVGGV